MHVLRILCSLPLLAVALAASVPAAPAGKPDLAAEWQREFGELERQMRDRAWCERVSS